MLTLVFLLLTTLLISVNQTADMTPYHWELRRVGDGHVVTNRTWLLSESHSFKTTLCALVPISPCKNAIGFYMCPAKGASYCNHPDHYYCAYWGCETVAPLWLSEGGKDSDLKVIYPPNCYPAQKNTWQDNTPVEGKPMCEHILINISNPRDSKWDFGKTWGLRYYEEGTDRGGFFVIQRYPAQPEGLHPLGPAAPTDSKTLSKEKGHNSTIWNYSPTRLYTTLDSTFNALNISQPNLTADCWLCVSPQPPFYVGIGITANLSDFGNYTGDKIKASASLCWWGNSPKLTLGDLKGKGTCLIGVNASPSDFCLPNATWKISTQKNHFLVAPVSTWLACDVGLIPCLDLQTWSQTGHCVVTQIIPQVYYYYGQQGFEHLNTGISWQRRLPVLVPILATLGVIGSTAVGASSLIVGHQQFKILSTQVDQDLSDLERSVDKLEKSVSSLAEVVLQNHRGLDLLFLRQGGLCIALGEKCCFYANHSGVIRDTLTQLWKRLQERETAHTSQESWYEWLFSWSPWLTTLISALVGPLTILLLLLIFRLCLLNKLIAFVKKLVSTVQLMVLRSQYQSLEPESQTSFQDPWLGLQIVTKQGGKERIKQLQLHFVKNLHLRADPCLHSDSGKNHKLFHPRPEPISNLWEST